MKTLPLYRWLLVAWLIYIFASMAVFTSTSAYAYFAGPQLDPSKFFFYMALHFLTQTITVIVGSLFLREALLKPLAAVSRAARRIAGGDLNFELPPSRVREIVEVSKAFDEMGKGLRAALARQAELEQERRLFIGAVAHDLRTPLFSLRGYLEGLEVGIVSTPDRIAHYVAVCRELAGDLESRISDLFAYARLEYLGQTPRRDPVDLSRLVAKVLQRFQLQLEAKNIEVKLDTAGETPCVEGDEQLLGRVFENLLDNAVRHTQPGGTIWVSWCQKEARLQFSVADNGPGIAAPDLPHLFEPLYRSEASRNRQTGGAGLGLAVAKRILLAHHGDITATNRTGGGAEFTGWLKC